MKAEEHLLRRSMRAGSNGNRIRVAIYQPRMSGGGAQRVTLTILNHLDRNRFDPVLVLRRQGGELLDHVPSDVSVYFLNSRVRTAWYRLKTLLREISPDVTLSISTMGNLTVCAGLLFSRIDSPLVVVEQNTFSPACNSSKWRLLRISFLKHMLYRRAGRVVAVSRGVAEDLMRSAHIPRNDLLVIYNPVVADELCRRSNMPVDHPWFRENIPIILSAGRLVPQKDYTMLLESFSRVRRERTVRLMIIGEGRLREQLASLAEELGIADDVALPGFVDNAPSYMKRCTIFALSSKYEGLPVALIEAMACGAPVVSTDCPSGPSEIITNGEDGLLVPVGDPEAMAEAMKLLLDNPQRRNEMRKKGLNRAKQFSVERSVDMYEELLETLVRGSAKSTVSVT